MKLIALGLLLVIAGAVLPFLMVVGVIETSLWLSAVSYTVSLVGLVAGIVAASRFLRPKCRE